MALTPFRWRLVVSDLDGTLLDRQQTISDEKHRGCRPAGPGGNRTDHRDWRIDQMAAISYARTCSVFKNCLSFFKRRI
jgi:hypothetical protein